MSLRKNFIYSSILTVSTYLFPLLVYPYVSRVLGLPVCILVKEGKLANKTGTEQETCCHEANSHFHTNFFHNVLNFNEYNWFINKKLILVPY